MSNIIKESFLRENEKELIKKFLSEQTEENRAALIEISKKKDDSALDEMREIWEAKLKSRRVHRIVYIGMGMIMFAVMVVFLFKEFSDNITIRNLSLIAMSMGTLTYFTSILKVQSGKYVK